ncbi:DUF1003 domain-containing protein [Gemmatimonas sp.]|uniref:DUF1003 domain-containing protein n=1 Tax=Gemmatimonas sp. TaxID=1962908 RepID=UPI003983C044
MTGAPFKESRAAERSDETPTTVDALAKRMLRRHWDTLSPQERTVIDGVLSRIAGSEIISHDTDAEFRETRNFGERMADRIATFGGSWTFILLFLSFLLTWAVLNTEVLGPRQAAFDPYPYIFLNLLLSMIAALQAPLIMMSQNRAAQRDRVEAKNDYGVNLKAELEIRQLHDKLDVLRESQWAEMILMQQQQIRMLDDLVRHPGRPARTESQ